MDPMPFTLRELVWMANSKRKSDWQIASSIEALYINYNSKKGAKQVHPDELNPFIKKKPRMITGSVAWDILKQVVENGKIS